MFYHNGHNGGVTLPQQPGCSVVHGLTPMLLRGIGCTISLLEICCPSGCTVVSGVVVVVVVVGGGVCNRSQMRTCKCTCLIFGVSIGLDPG